MTMTFLDRQVTSAYQEAQKATQIPQEYQRLTALMECAAAGNEHCFEALYDALVPRLYALINRILHNRTHAEEVTQEVFLEIWQKAPLYRAERGTVLSWAATIAHRRAVDRVRSVAASTERDFTRGLEEYRESYHHVDTQDPGRGWHHRTLPETARCGGRPCAQCLRRRVLGRPQPRGR